VVAFSTSEGWSQDISKTIAQELRRRCDLHCTRAARHIEAGMSNPRAVRYRRLALVEQDNEKADLLRRIADECERGVLFTADWISARGLGGRNETPAGPVA
jgi:hypothetical protein